MRRSRTSFRRIRRASMHWRRSALGTPVVYELRSSWEDAAVSSGIDDRRQPALSAVALAGNPRAAPGRSKSTRSAKVCAKKRSGAVSRRDRVTVVPNSVDAEAFARAVAPAATGGRGYGSGGQVRARIHRLVLRLGRPRAAGRGAAATSLRCGRTSDCCWSAPGPMRPRCAPQSPLRARAERRLRRTGAARRVGALYDMVDILVYPRIPMRLTDMVTPLKPLEAMALRRCSLPPMSADIASWSRTAKRACCSSAGDRARWRRRFCGSRLMRRCARGSSENGPRFVREHRTWAGVVQRYEAVYAGLTIASAPSPSERSAAWLVLIAGIVGPAHVGLAAGARRRARLAPGADLSPRAREPIRCWRTSPMRERSPRRWI